MIITAWKLESGWAAGFLSDTETADITGWGLNGAAREPELREDAVQQARKMAKKLIAELTEMVG